MSMARSIAAKLDELAELRTAAELTRADYETRRAAILQSVQAELDALSAEFEPLFEAVEERTRDLEEEIRQDVLAYGQSVKGLEIQAVYNRGRVTWDSKRLDAYAERHPEIIAFRKEGEPSVALRHIKEKG